MGVLAATFREIRNTFMTSASSLELSRSRATPFRLKNNVQFLSRLLLSLTRVLRVHWGPLGALRTAQMPSTEQNTDEHPRQRPTSINVRLTPVTGRRHQLRLHARYCIIQPLHSSSSTTLSLAFGFNNEYTAQVSTIRQSENILPAGPRDQASGRFHQITKILVKHSCDRPARTICNNCKFYFFTTFFPAGPSRLLAGAGRVGVWAGAPFCSTLE